MLNITFTAILYDPITISIEHQKTFDTPEEAIAFAKAHQYDQVVKDNTSEIIWRKGDTHCTWPRERFAIKEPGKDVTHFFTTMYRATKFAKERGYPEIYDEVQDCVVWRNPDAK